MSSRILLVEDEPGLAMTLSDLLTRVESQPAKGRAFIVRLPVTPAEATE